MREEASAIFIMPSAWEGSYWYHFKVFSMTRPGIKPGPTHTLSGRVNAWDVYYRHTYISRIHQIHLRYYHRRHGRNSR